MILTIITPDPLWLKGKPTTNATAAVPYQML